MPDPGDDLRGGDGRDAHLDGVAGGALGEHGEEVLDEQAVVGGRARREGRRHVGGGGDAETGRHTGRLSPAGQAISSSTATMSAQAGASTSITPKWPPSTSTSSA